MEAFDEISGDEVAVEEIRLWLLIQKQVQDWGSTKATADAVYALLRRGKDLLTENPTVEIKAGGMIFHSDKGKSEAGTGYFRESAEGKSVKPEMGKISVTIKGNQVKSISWGAAYWQYFEDIDKISPSATPLKLAKNFFIEKNSDKGPVLFPLNEGEPMKVGDKLKVRIELRCDRDMEYIHMKDLRASGTEPINVISQYKWQGGLGYYEATRDASTDFFFSWLSKGTWVFEYALFVTHNGNFSAGISSIESMYAPEFNSHSEGSRISVK
jgi:Bacterial Alpha-2-macroglobulin MG10 domain